MNVLIVVDMQNDFVSGALGTPEAREIVPRVKSRVEDGIRRGAKGLLKEVSLFDIYRGKGIPEGKKSVAFNLVLRADDRSLTSEEADQDVASILSLLEQELGAVLR